MTHSRISKKIGTIREVPFYLCHQPGEPFDTERFCDAEGKPFTAARLQAAHISPREVADLFQAEGKRIAQVLNHDISRIGLRLTSGEPPAIIQLKKSE